jgi:hypothetical protein
VDPARAGATLGRPSDGVSASIKWSAHPVCSPALGRGGHILLVGLAAAVAATLPAARPAGAVDAFEIQVYDGTANPPGVPGLELHVNGVPIGPDAAPPPPPELPAEHQAHFTLEPSLGMTPWWELGAYLQTALLPDGAFDFAGAKLRSKFVTPPGWQPHLRLGCNLEVSWLPAKFEPDRWGMEIRNIVAWEDRHVLVAINPIIDLSLTGGPPSFEPAVAAVYKLRPELSLGFEYYGDTTGGLHYLFEVANYDTQHIEVNIGVGEGLTAASNGLVTKMILGYRFD